MAKYCYSAAVLLLMVVVTAQGQITGPDRPTTGVQLYLEKDMSNGNAIANFTVLSAAFFTDTQGNILWCQSANNGNPIGDWYFPAGDQVDVIDDSGPFHVLHVDGQIGLLRDQGVASLEGLYNCVIPDENNINQTLWVGIYRNATYYDASKNFIIDDPMEFSLVSSSSDTDPPVFTLSFNVTNVPPTTVQCYVDNTIIDIEYVDRLVIMAEDPVRVLVTVTINIRQSGSYHCDVSADSPGGIRRSTDSLNITVTDIPTNVTLTARPGFQQAIINWSPPISNTPIVQGYDVYYESPNGTRLSNNISNSSTMTTLDNLDPELYYSVFVVALGGDLPSPASSMVNISEAYSIVAPNATTVSLGDTDILVVCTLTVNVELSSLNFVWFLDDLINSTMMDFNQGSGSNSGMGLQPLPEDDTILQLTLDLNIDVVNVTDAGVYICGSMLTDALGIMANVTTEHTVFVQLPNPDVTINTVPGTSVGRTFITGDSNIFCNVEIPIISVPVTTMFTWWGPNGQITDGVKYDILNVLDQDNNINISHLVIHNLESNDNLTMYYCQVQLAIDTDGPPVEYTDYIIPGITTTDNVTISFEELPVASVNINPDGAGAPIIGMDFSVVCNATFNETIAEVSYQWFINGSQSFRSGVSFSNNNSILTVTNVSTSDEGMYTCSVTLDIVGMEITTDTVTNKTYEFATLDDPIVVISAVGSNIAGSVYTLTCTVSVVTGMPNITWIDPTGNEVDDSLVTLNTNSELVLQLPSLSYTDIGVYGCFANLSVPDVNFLGMGSDSVTVNIQIPIPTVTITTDTTDTFIRGTERSITCNITLNPPLPMNTNVTLEWRKDVLLFDNSTDRVFETSVMEDGNTYSSTILFSPVNTTDGGYYECIGIVNPEMENDNIISNSNNGSLSLTIDDIPDANVTLSATGSGMINGGYSLTCTVSTAEGLIGFYANLTLEKMTDNGYEVLDYSNGTAFTVDLSPLTTFNAGMYKCSYDTRQDTINYQRIFDDFINISVAIPPPIVQVTTDPDNINTLIEGTYIDLVCNISINEGVDTDIRVTVVWSKNGTAISNDMVYTISNVTLVSGYYISTVRIEELQVTDNNAVFTCTVTATPTISTFITENNGNVGITLSVQAFTSTDVTVAITFSSVPTAGDVLNVTCSATVPERFIHSPSTFIISYDSGSQMVVADGNPDATQSNVSTDGNIFSRVVTINPVKTSDARRYHCIVTFNDPIVVIVNNNEDLQVYIAPPTMSISLTPNDIIYESTLLVITCNATLPSVVDTTVTATVTWTGPNGIVNNNERIMINEAISIGDNLFQSLLTFQPVDNGDANEGTNDAGMYTCKMDISSTDSLILSSVNNITEDFTITDLPDLEVTISTSGSTEVGQSLNITCSVVLVEGLVGNINITWDKIDTISDIEGLSIPIVTMVDGGMTNVTLVMDPVLFEYRGMYICVAMYNVTVTDDAETQSADYNLTVNFPPFDVAISQDYTDPLYTGTNLTITCSITLDSLVNIPVIVNNQWTRNGNGITESTITDDLVINTNLTYTATLEFFPLYHMTDDGNYQCSVNVLPDVTDNYVTSISNSASTTIDVLDLPNPVVTVSRTLSNPSVGDSFEFVCNVSVVDRLIVSPEISWSKYASVSNPLPEDDINVDPILENPFELSLTFASLNTSDAGRYTCDATVTIPQINEERSSNNSEDLILQIPAPFVTVTPSQSDDILLAGSQLTIFCDITIDEDVDTNFTVSTTWTMIDNNSNANTLDATSGRVVVYSPYSTGFNQYQSRIEFSTLSSIIDPGDYTCDVIIDSNTQYTFIFDSDNDNDTTTIQVINPSIGNFSAFPDNFLGLETSCSDSDPFDDFTLNCSASKPAIVLPDLQLFWRHNGTLRSSNSITYNMTIDDVLHKLTVLSFPTSTVEDSGSYICVALLDIPDSDNITRMEETGVVIRPPSLPYAAINISITVTNTTATITFIIPAIAYTPEQYHIEYIGLELQNVLTNSTTVIMGPDDITATDIEYNITLNGLEEDNSYDISVVSTNCQGSTQTSDVTLTTDPGVPTGIVLDCTNTTFNPTDVTLDWEPPVRIDQNGEITGYQLYCQQQGSSVPVPDTNGTMDSPNTTYTIPVITPFRLYNCSLAAINSEGTGPQTFCQFYSAQDAPSDSPTVFTSIAEKFAVEFTWASPDTPNGIITQYLLTISIMEISRTGEMIYNTSTSLLDATVNSFTMSNLSAYQNYNATIAARTVVGFGPESETNGTTQPDTSTPVQLFTFPATGFTEVYTLEAVNSSTLNITWQLPIMPNGYISSYNIDVINRRSEPNQPISVSAVDGQDTYTYLVTGLNAGTPYYITIGAVNQLGQGENITVTAFTGNLDTTVTPVVSDPVRSADGTEITVSWTPILLEQSGGFFNTIVTLTRSSRKRQTTPVVVEVPFNESSVTFTDLEPAAEYSVTTGVGVVGQDGGMVTGEESEPITVEPNPEHKPQTADNTPIIGGVVGGVLFLIIIILIVVVVLVVIARRGRTGKAEFNRKGQRNDLFELSSPSGGTVLRPLEEPSDLNGTAINGNTSPFTPLENEPDPVRDEEEDPKKKLMEEDMAYLEAEKSIDRSKPIAKASFHEHVQQLHEDADKEYESEYKSVPMSTDASIDSGKSEVNKQKNRFVNIFPYDFSRVKLPLLGGAADSDYINASTVDGYNRKDCYVCAQGPLPTTVGDFWRMIYEKKINNLVMLTGLVEGGKKKCEQYWPDNVGETMDLQGGLQVAMTSKVPFSDYTIHSLKVTQPGNKEASVLDVNHFHFTAWPDHGVPQFATSLIGFINRVQKSHDKSKGIPLLVHCSAGVGRTGTFVMLDTMMDRLRVEDSLNVYEFLKQMRSKRMFMVQTLTQYVFIHDALDEYITCGETDIPGSNLKVRVSKMHKIVPSKNITGFQEQYQLLDNVCYVPAEAAYSDAKKPFNTPKNRYPDIVPLNLNRPRLRPDGSEGSDYINGSCVDGYKQRNAYLVTQGPLKATADDFWRLIVEFKSRNIVMLCNTVEEGQEKCYMYWPTKEGEPVEYGKHKVTLQSETVSGDYIIRKLLVQNDKSSLKAEREGFVITQFHYTGWPEHGHPPVTGQIIEMVDMLTRVQMNTGNKPITVVCNDGVGRSGAFLCIHSQLERLKTEGEIDVFKYLKSARTKRIGLVSEMDHYVFVHEVLADYVESFDPYANFKN